MPIYMNITSIAGDSTSKNFTNQHELSSFSFGLTHPTGVASKPIFDMFGAGMLARTGATKLMLACAAATNLGSVVITVTKLNSANEQVIEKYTLDNAFVTAFGQSGDSGAIPTQDLSLAFSKVTYAHTSYDNTGKGTTVTNNWDIPSNKGG